MRDIEESTRSGYPCATDDGEGVLMSKWRLVLLGSPQVVKNDRPEPIALRKAIALLAYLAVEKRRFSREFLATLLWPELGEKQSLANLRQTLSLLRRVLGDECLTTDGDHIRLDSNLVDVDVNEFVALSSGEDGNTNNTEHLERASELYRGSFLEGFTLGNCLEFDRWQDAVRERLFLGFDAVLSTLCRRLLADDAPDRALPFAQRWLLLDPVNEAPHRALMEIHARAGRKNAARKQYEACTQILRAEDREPDELTHELHEAISAGHFEPSETGPAPEPSEQPDEPGTKHRSVRTRKGLVLAAAAVLAAVVIVSIAGGLRRLSPDIAMSRVEIQRNGRSLSLVRGTMTNAGRPRSQVGYSLLFLSDRNVVAHREYVVFKGTVDIDRDEEVVIEVDREPDIQRYVEEHELRIPPGMYSAALIVTAGRESTRSGERPRGPVNSPVTGGDLATGRDLFFYSGTAADDTFELTITFEGATPLNEANPMRIYIRGFGSHGDSADSKSSRGWGEFRVVEEGRYFLPVYDVPVRDSDGSGYVLLIVHDAGADLQDPFFPGPGDVAGVYREADEPGSGQLDLATATRIYPGRRYALRFVASGPAIVVPAR
jgi:DNA-binding SARP family transcriptional activator